MRMLAPILIQNQQQLLRPPQRKHGYETPPPSRDDPLDRARKPRFPLGPRRVNLHPVRALHDQQVGLDVILGQLRRHQVSVFLHAVVAGVENGPPADFDEEHGGAEDVAGVEGVEFEAGGEVEIDGLVVVDEFNFVDAGLQFSFGVEDVRVGGGVVAAVVGGGGVSAAFHGHEAEVIPQ